MSQTKAQLLEGNSSQSLSLSSAAVAVGTASAPTITFTGDLNTGIYSPGADQVAISTGGTGRLFVDSSGRVGLGTSTVGSSGNANITIAGANNSGIQFGRTNATAGGGLLTSASGPGIAFYHYTGAVGSETYTEGMRLTSTGLGIGTATPQDTIDCLGRIRVTQSGNNPRFGSIEATADEFQLKAFGGAAGQTAAMCFYTGNNSPTEKARLTSDGKFLVGTTTADTSGNALLQVNGSIKGTITSGTAVASTSGTAIDFTGIPSWVKRITVLIADVSTNSGNACLIQFGSSGTIQTTNYKARNNYIGGNNLTSTSGFPWGVNGGAGTNTFRGSFMCNLVDASTNVWIVSGAVDVQDGNGGTALTQGRVTLSGTLNILRLQAGTIGTETFDAGTVNIIYEG